MAKIIKVAPATHTPNVANPFRTSRNSTTNPFKYSNFEGNTLQFADVFEGFEQPKNINKLKLIASSVAGSMNKIRTGITEPIARFVGKVKSAWNYAANTNISDLAAVKRVNEIMSHIEIPSMGLITDSLSGLKGKWSEITGTVNKNISHIGENITGTWSAVVSKFHGGKITSDMPVSELENLWRAEISAVELGGAA